MRRLICIFLLALVSCDSCVEEKQIPAPRVYTWPSWPIRMALSSNLTPCQRAGIIAGVAYWEALVGHELIKIFDVNENSLSVSGLPSQGVVGVLQAPMSRPGTLDQVEWITLKQNNLQTKFLHSAEMRVAGCSLQAYAHEVGHVLGLEHSYGPNMLMNKVHDGDAWVVLDSEIESIMQPL